MIAHKVCAFVMGLVLTIVTALSIVVAPTAAGAVEPFPGDAPAPALGAVQNATRTATQTSGAVVTGAPGNTPSMNVSGSGEVTGVSPAGTIGISIPRQGSTTQAILAGAYVFAGSSPVASVVNATTGGIQVSQDLLGPSAPVSIGLRSRCHQGMRHNCSQTASSH